MTWNRTSSLDELTRPIYALSDVKIFEFGPDATISVERVAWSPRVKSLVFVDRFNKPITRVEWPPELRQIPVGLDSNHLTEGACPRAPWPAVFRHFGGGSDFNQPIDDVAWPASLQELTFGACFNQSVERTGWPRKLRVMCLEIASTGP